MALSVNFKDARLSGMALAKVGNPLKEEPLHTSKTLCHFQQPDAELLTHCFLKSFRSLELHRLQHHSDVASNELYGYASTVFDSNETLLANSALIARHLHAKSNHPNIKSGDLCVALIDDIKVAGQTVQGISIVKSESKVPFLQISMTDGDLRLTTQQGIYPDKIDKGCLILNHDRADGYVVYLFDRGGGNTHFWNRDFVGAAPVKNDDYLTKRYSELCVAFAEQGLPNEIREEERLEVANKAISYLSEADNFDLGEFQDVALQDPQMIEQFSNFKSAYEEEKGQEFEDHFTVSKPEAKKAKKKLKGRIKLDTGVDVRFSSAFIDQADRFLERGFDEDKHMNYVKVYFHQEV